MEKKYTYKKQGDGRDSWTCEVTDNGKLIDKYMVYELTKEWGSLRQSLMRSIAFKRIIKDPTLINNVAYGALQTILSTEGDEQDLLIMLQNTMQYTDSENLEINSILEANNFTVRL